MDFTASVLPVSVRAACPPGACDCGWAQQAALHAESQRLALLTPAALDALLQHLRSAPDWDRLRHLMARMHNQLGITLVVAPGKQHTQGLKGLLVQMQPLTGLCRKTRHAIVQAVRQALQARPSIAITLLNEDSLFAAPVPNEKPCTP